MDALTAEYSVDVTVVHWVVLMAVTLVVTTVSVFVWDDLWVVDLVDP